MILQSLAFTNFKNHTKLEVSPSVKWNVVTGLNGRGKTNALDGIYMLCVLKSFLNHSLEACVSYDHDFFRLEGHMENKDKIELTYAKEKSRKLIFNGKKITKVGDYIGRYPVLVIQPIDDYKLLEGSQARRRILDQAIAQMDGDYLQALMSYNRLLKQRNALLKHMRSSGNKYFAQLDMYAPQLIECTEILYNGRKSLVDAMSTDLSNFYHMIADGNELPDIAYKADVLPDVYPEMMKRNYEIDVMAGRTTKGPHLDDLTLLLDGHPLKTSGSQGQRKSFLVAVKLAIYRIMADWTEKLPILLLDDLFDKLDNDRVGNLLKLINSELFGQVFISDKDDEHLVKIFDTLNFTMKHIKLN